MQVPRSAEDMATHWANKITARLEEMGVPANELQETKLIVTNFTRIAWQDLETNPQLDLPHLSAPYVFNAEQKEEILDLFLRAVNQSAKQTRRLQPEWDERRITLEKIAEPLLNMGKTLICLRENPDSKLPVPLKSKQEIQALMKQMTSKLIHDACGGQIIQNFSIPRRQIRP